MPATPPMTIGVTPPCTSARTAAQTALPSVQATTASTPAARELVRHRVQPPKKRTQRDVRRRRHSLHLNARTPHAAQAEAHTRNPPPRLDLRSPEPCGRASPKASRPRGAMLRPPAVLPPELVEDGHELRVAPHLVVAIAQSTHSGALQHGTGQQGPRWGLRWGVPAKAATAHQWQLAPARSQVRAASATRPTPGGLQAPRGGARQHTPPPPALPPQCSHRVARRQEQALLLGAQ